MLQLLLLLWVAAVRGLRVPLESVFQGPNSSLTYQVHFDFQNSHTYVPVRSNMLYLQGFNLKLPSLIHENSYVKIGLQYPSDFISAVSSHFGVNDTDIELGFSPTAELFLNEVNFVEGRDEFVSGQLYDISVVYNYGRSIRIPRQTCELTEGEDILFNEYMILEVLNSMPAENGISYTRSGNKIMLDGKLSNFPHIIINHGNLQIPLFVQGPLLKLNAEATANRIGIQALKGYSKVQVRQHAIVLKRSSFNIVLYIFLGLFLVFSLLLTWHCRRDMQFTMNFVQLLFRSTFLKDNRARVTVLTTQLE